jgi:beta-aspartyl-dipeptidase (metallo-type)
MLFITNCDLYTPRYAGKRDILACGNRIAGVFASGTLSAGGLRAVDGELELLDAEGAAVIPGIIDRHIHFNGAGGEGGPQYRTPPLQLSAFIQAGVTSAVGLLGTDGTCRSLRELLMKARALETEGISAWILTGSYSLPSATLTGDIQSDLCLIDKVIGLKIALSDHRSSHPSIAELRKAVSDARTGGMLSGKAGAVCVHMGVEEPAFEPLLETIKGTGIPITQFAPTHIARSADLLKKAALFGKAGGYLDITVDPGSKSGGIPVQNALKELLENGARSENITFSSDGNGSMPKFDEAGRFASMGVAPITAVLDTLLELWDDRDFDTEAVLAMASSNPAAQLNLARKGRIEKGMDCDLLVIDGTKGARRLRHVVSKGLVMMKDGAVCVKGTFEN